MIARERIRVRRIQGHPWPWSLDDVLNNRRFTNVKREHDRTSKWMRQHFTDPHAPAVCNYTVRKLAHLALVFGGMC